MVRTPARFAENAISSSSSVKQNTKTGTIYDHPRNHKYVDMLAMLRKMEKADGRRLAVHEGFDVHQSAGRNPRSLIYGGLKAAMERLAVGLVRRW